MNRNVSFETIERVKQQKHMHDPFIVRHGYWVKDAVTDEFARRFSETARSGPTSSG